MRISIWRYRSTEAPSMTMGSAAAAAAALPGVLEAPAVPVVAAAVPRERMADARTGVATNGTTAWLAVWMCERSATAATRHSVGLTSADEASSVLPVDRADDSPSATLALVPPASVITSGGTVRTRAVDRTSGDATSNSTSK